MSGLLSRDALAADGFIGWKTWAELRAARFHDVPSSAGTYVVYRPSAEPPRFVAMGTGGRFKGRDPNVLVPMLRAKWVESAHAVYVGKADRPLKERLRAYARFGAGEPVAHWGGRYIWQLADAGDLLVAWRELDGRAATALDAEREFLDAFADGHDGRLPFANLRR
jgi:hypothetical protein